jgi:hypothetical protein
VLTACNSAPVPWLQCLKYKTDQHKDVKRVEKLNNFFLRLMCAEEVTAQTAAAISAAIEEEGRKSLYPVLNSGFLYIIFLSSESLFIIYLFK